MKLELPKIGYALDRKARPLLAEQLAALRDHGLPHEQIYIDANDRPGATWRGLEARKRIIGIASGQGGYEIIVATPACLILGLSDGKKIIPEILGYNCAITILNEDKTLTKSNVGMTGILDLIEKATIEIRKRTQAQFHIAKYAKTARTKAKLKAAAARDYGERVLPNSEIAKKHGVTPKTLYNWFGSREEYLNNKRK